MSKKIRLAFLLILLVGMFVFTTMTVSTAATTATTASIVVTVVQDDNKTPLKGFTSSCVSVKNSAGETLDQALDYSISMGSNIVTVSNITFADTYYVTFATSSTIQTATAIVNAKISNTPKTAKLKWSSSGVYSAANSGAIAGLTVDGSGNVLTGVTVKAYTKDTIYETRSAAVTGAYKLFVPAGTYTMVIVGKDTTTDYANIGQSIKVTAGQAVGPMTDKNGQTPWSSMSYDSQIGLAGLTISGSSKLVTGTAAKDTTVSIYEYNCPKNGNTVDLGYGEIGYPILYSFIGSQKVTATGTATSGTFSITLPEYPAGKKYVVKVVDSNLNSNIDVAKDWTYVSATVPKITAALGSDPAATVATKINITETEPTGVAIGNFNSNITSVVVSDGSVSFSLTPSQYSKATKGKLIINEGVLTTAQTFTITVSATGYNDVSVVQVVGVSITPPPSTLTGTFTVLTGGGTVPGSARFSSIGTVATGNTLGYVVTSSSIQTIFLGNKLTSYQPLVVNTDITGLNPTTTKYIDVVEVNTTTNTVVKLKRFTLTAAQIAMPRILSMTASGTSLVMVANGTLNSSSIPDATAFTVKSGASGATANTVTNVAISGRKVTLTLATAIATTDSINLKYAVPTTSALADAAGNKLAAISATTGNVLNCVSGPTFSSAVVSTGTRVTVTMSASCTSTGTLGNVYKVYVNGKYATVLNASVSGTTVTINLVGTTIESGDTVTVDYVPTSYDYMMDSSNKKAPAFSGAAATNPL